MTLEARHQTDLQQPQTRKSGRKFLLNWQEGKEHHFYQLKMPRPQAMMFFLRMSLNFLLKENKQHGMPMFPKKEWEHHVTKIQFSSLIFCDVFWYVSA